MSRNLLLIVTLLLFQFFSLVSKDCFAAPRGATHLNDRLIETASKISELKKSGKQRGFYRSVLRRQKSGAKLPINHPTRIHKIQQEHNKTI